MYGAESFPKVSTGTDLVTSSSNAMMTTNSPGTLSRMSPMESVQELFVSMANSLQAIVENTTQTNELLKGTDAQRRDKNIGDSDTDGDEDKPKDKGPGAFDKLKGIFSKLNPFSGGGLGPIGTAVIAGLGLLGLNMFGDEAQKGIEYLLDALKNGKIGTMLSDFGDSIKEQFTRLKKMLGSIITGITEYINKFDIDNSGTLDSDELDLLMEDIKDKFVNMISEFGMDVLKSVAGGVLGFTLINKTVGALTGKLAPILSGGSKLATASVGTRLLAGASIAGLLLYGVTSTWSNVSNSLADTIEQDGKFSFGGFFANFFGGDKKGGIMNALRKGFEVGGTFALAGMAIGAILGSPFGGIGAIPGALAGGLIGTGIGFLVGAFTGWLGSDRLKAFGTGINDMLDEAAAFVGNFFKDLFSAAKSFFTGSATSYSIDEDRITTNITKGEDKLKEKEDERAKILEENPKANVRRLDNDIRNLKKKLEKDKEALANIDQSRLQRKDDVIDDFALKIISRKEEKDRYLKKLAIAVKDNNVTGHQGIEFLTGNIQRVNQEMLKLESDKKEKLAEDGIDYQIVQPVNRIDAVLSGFSGPNAMGGVNVTTIKGGDTNTKIENNSTTNDFNPYPSDVERMLNRLNGMGVA